MRMLVAALCLTACGGSSDKAATCPDKIADHKETWTYTGSDDTCAAIAEEANKDNSGMCPGESSAFTLQAQGPKCVATLTRRCEDVTITVMCDVQASGAADCSATVAAGEVMCDFKVTER